MHKPSPDPEGHGTSRALDRRSFLKKSIQSGIAVGLWAAGGCATGSRSTLPNILLITLDTTRFDRLSCYGYSLPTSPNLDALAAESVLYTRAYSTSSWTLPAHASLFTGKLVSSHGAQKDPTGPLKLSAGIQGNKDWDQLRARGLSVDETTLAQILKQVGYDTSAVVAGPWMKKVFGLNRGFDYYDDNDIKKVSGRAAPEVTRNALHWLRSRDNAPFFLFLNYFDVHTPYVLPERDARMFMPEGGPDAYREYTDHMFSPAEERPAGYREFANYMYDAEIRYMDKYIGKLFDMMKSIGMYDNTMIIVTADHGEMMGEHGRRGHGKSLFEPEIHIPQFVKYPEGEVAHSVFDARTLVVDILPLILERIGAPIPSGIQGTLPDQRVDPIVAEVYPLEFFTSRGDFQAIWDGKYKFVLNSKGNHALYDLDADPDEMKNLVNEDAELAAELKSKLTTRLAALPKPGRAGPEQAVGEELSETLESLGYLE